MAERHKHIKKRKARTATSSRGQGQVRTQKWLAGRTRDSCRPEELFDPWGHRGKGSGRRGDDCNNVFYPGGGVKPRQLISQRRKHGPKYPPEEEVAPGVGFQAPPPLPVKGIVTATPGSCRRHPGRSRHGHFSRGKAERLLSVGARFALVDRWAGNWPLDSVVYQKGHPRGKAAE